MIASYFKLFILLITELSATIVTTVRTAIALLLCEVRCKVTLAINFATANPYLNT